MKSKKLKRPQKNSMVLASLGICFVACVPHLKLKKSVTQKHQ